MQDCTFTKQKNAVNIVSVALMPSSAAVNPVIVVHRENIHQNSNTVEDIFNLFSNKNPLKQHFVISEGYIKALHNFKTTDYLMYVSLGSSPYLFAPTVPGFTENTKSMIAPTIGTKAIKSHHADLSISCSLRNERESSGININKHYKLVRSCMRPC